VARIASSNESQNLTPTSSARNVVCNTLFYTIDVSRVQEIDRGQVSLLEIHKTIEKEVKATKALGNFDYVGVVRDHYDEARIRVAYRSEEELQLVKEAANKILVLGVWVLRD
jgi:hypothetical protein